MDQEKNAAVQLPQTWAVDWEIRERLGAGAYSTVYKAVRRDHPGVDAAIKVISIPASDEETESLMAEGFSAAQSQKYYDDIAAKYITEIELLEGLKGTQHVVSIEDYKLVRREDAPGNRIYIRMELLRPLDSYLRNRMMTEQEVIRAGTDLCGALELCEAKRIIHRDIKPANIFVNDRTPNHIFYKLGDFGIARDTQALTHGLSTRGTPSYMAPEVFFSKEYDNRADIYSLGITLYRLANQNRLPLVPTGNFSASIREEALKRRIGGEQLPLPCAVSSELGQIILKACAFRPEDRYRSAAEMRRELEALMREESTLLTSPGMDEPTMDMPFADVQPETGYFTSSSGGTGMPDLTPTGGGNIGTVPLTKPQGQTLGQTSRVEPGRKPEGAVVTGGKGKTPVWAWIVLALLVVSLAAVAILLLGGRRTEPDPVPTAAMTATPEPTPEPTAEPTAEPTSEPTQEPTAEPTPEPTPEPTEEPSPEPTAEPEPTPEETEAPKTGETLLLTVDQSEVMTHQGFTFSGMAPGARHLRVELFGDGEEEPFDARDADGSVIEASFGVDHGMHIRAVMAADYEDGRETQYSEPVEVTVAADGSVGPLSVATEAVWPENKTVTGKLYAEGAEWYHVRVERADEGDTCVTEFDPQPDASGYGSFLIDAGLLEKGGIYRISATGCRTGKNTAYRDAYFIVAGEADPDRPVTLTVENETEKGAFLAYQQLNVCIEAPGATALRVYIDGHWEWNWGNEKWNNSWFFGAGDRIMVAEASYDDVDWNSVDWSTFDFGRDMQWQSMSNAVRLEMYSQYGPVSAPEAEVIADGPTEGGFMEVALTKPSDTPGAYYGAWVERQTEDGGWEYAQDVCWTDDRGLFSAFSMPEGHYRAVVETYAPGYDPARTEMEFDLSERGGNALGLRVTRDEIRTCENTTLFLGADGAEQIKIRFTREGDPNYQDEWTADGPDIWWSWSTASAGVYCLTPCASYPETDEVGNRLTDEETGEPRSREETGETVRITVTADGDLEAPVFGTLPALHQAGAPLEVPYRLPAETGYWSFSIDRIPDEGDWQATFFRDEQEPAEKEGTLSIGAECFGEPGTYLLKLYANAAGWNDANNEATVVAISGERSERVTLDINGSNEEAVTCRAGEEIHVRVHAPDATALRMKEDGWDWRYYDGRFKDEEGCWNWYPVYNSGERLYAVQACFDEIDWDTVDWGTFDWHALNWSETGNAIRLTVEAEGSLEVPRVSFKDQVTRGEWMDVGIEPVPGAERYSLWIDRLNENDEWIDCPVNMNFLDAGTIRVPTACLPAGERYRMHAAAYARGYNSGDAEDLRFSVEGEEPAEAVFAIDTTEVRINEPFQVFIWAPGGRTVRFCHEELDNVWAEEPDHIANTWTCDQPGEYRYRAFAFREEDQTWEPLGEPITVRVAE